VEGSRERLGVEAIDLYQIHWPVPEEEIEGAGRRSPS
jgi:diketogulonate reductase-like aldo/keto reductase